VGQFERGVRGACRAPHRTGHALSCCRYSAAALASCACAPRGCARRDPQRVSVRSSFETRRVRTAAKAPAPRPRPAPAPRPAQGSERERVREREEDAPAATVGRLAPTGLVRGASRLLLLFIWLLPTRKGGGQVVDSSVVQTYKSSNHCTRHCRTNVRFASCRLYQAGRLSRHSSRKRRCTPLLQSLHRRGRQRFEIDVAPQGG